jgi:hypothetical protein
MNIEYYECLGSDGLNYMIKRQSRTKVTVADTSATRKILPYRAGEIA